ncbi:hypothetical protein THERU_02725 [Thermocrinis ruber]|uniref:Uncharacterized protein n=1 Tax=Thermocrinis ruber TaxID=75906 RepID=W0DHS3_9AQUI|nr:hypothetical protein THERU_02725 [Thermocrinis ruber]
MIENIDREKIKKRAKEIFKFCDYSHFYQILAYLRFDCLYKKNKDKINKEDKIWFEEVYKQMFERYIVDDFSDKVEKNNLPYLKSLYRTVRNIAFLVLDSFYTPSGLNLSPVLLFDNPELIRSIVFGETEISNTLKFLYRQLYKSVYLNEKVLAIQSLYYEYLKEKLKTKIEDLKNGIDICNCDFVNKIYDELIKDIIKEVKNDVKSKSKCVPIMRFEFEDEDLSEQFKKRLGKARLVKINSNSNYYRVVWKTPLNFYVIQYNSRSDKRSSITAFEKSFNMVKKFLKCIKDKYNGAGYIEHKRDVIEKIAKKYIEQALKLFFNSKDVRWEWDHTSFLRSYFNFPDAVIGFADDVIKFYENNIISEFNKKHNGTSKSVKKELEAKSKVVEKLKNDESIKGKDILCMTISNLIAYSVHSGDQLMEVDGLILGLTTGKQLFICLIEAKSGNKKAVKNLKSKICARVGDILEVYDISDIPNLINSVEGLDDDSIAYLIITDDLLDNNRRKNPNLP